MLLRWKYISQAKLRYSEPLHLAGYLISRLHDHLDVEVLRSHGQQLIVVIADIPGVTRNALKLLECGGLLGLAWSGWRRLVACFN